MCVPMAERAVNDVELKEKDKIGEVVQILSGVRDLCVILEEGQDIPCTAFAALQAAIERAIGILDELTDD